MNAGDEIRKAHLDAIRNAGAGAAARKALLDGQAARDADNAAAAQADAMRGKPIIIPLGEDGAWNVYWSRPHKSLYRLKMNEHSGAHLRRMAKLADYARWLAPDLPPDAVGEAERRIIKQAKDWMIDETDGRKFDPDMVRGRGVWNDADGVIYNAGNACFLVLPDGRMEQVDGLREPYIYDAGAPLIHPAADALTDEEGARLVDFYRARPWAQDANISGELLGGWIVCAFLAGLLPFRPHIWVNAPAHTGKSTLKCDVLRAAGAHGKHVDKVTGGDWKPFEGAATSSANFYQRINQDVLPVVFDEAEGNGSKRNTLNLAGVLSLMRSSATSGDVGLGKGGADGTAKNYRLQSCFLLFSIANMLDREADTSRCLVLRLSPLMDAAARAAMYERQEAARAMVQGQDFTARLFTRLLRAVPALLDNARAIREHLMAAEHNPRRAEMLGLLLAGAHALTKSSAVDAAYLEHVTAVAQAVEETQERESDMQRCLDALLGYSMPWHGSRISVAQLCKIARDGKNLDSGREAGDTLESLGLRWRYGLDALEVDHKARGLLDVFRGTDWASGKILPVLGEGTDHYGKRNALGIFQRSVKRKGQATSCYLLIIPAAQVIPSDE